MAYVETKGEVPKMTTPSPLATSLMALNSIGDKSSPTSFLKKRFNLPQLKSQIQAVLQPQPPVLIDDLRYGLGTLIDNLMYGLGTLIDDLRYGLGTLIDDLRYGLGTLIDDLMYGLGTLIGDLRYGLGTLIDDLRYGLGTLIDDIRYGLGTMVNPRRRSLLCPAVAMVTSLSLPLP